MEPTNHPPTIGEPDLTTVVSNVLGNLAFMITDDEPGELPAGTVWMQGEISYSGPDEGLLRCWCTRDFGIRLAANLLGIESQQGEALMAAEDAVREFMNVLGGQLVTAWHGTEAVFNLSIPTICECLDAPRLADADADSCCQLSIDGEPLFFTYHRAT